jgi:hypothetical protein
MADVDSAAVIPFDDWITPRAALNLMRQNEFDICALAIGHRIQDGLIRTAAETFVLKGKPPRDNVFLPLSFWEGWPFLADLTFWNNGDTVRFIKSSGGYSSSVEARAYNIRLDPAGVAKLPNVRLPIRPTPIRGNVRLPLALGAPEAGTSADVTRSEFDAWFAGLSSEDQCLGLLKLWAKAKAAHPGRKLVRKLPEAVVRGRKTGRPKRPDQ